MSVRLQVLLEEHELEELRRDAERRGMTVSEFVRQTLRSARRDAALGDPARKLAAVRSAARHGFPTADIEQMVAEIERGYGAP